MRSHAASTAASRPSPHASSSSSSVVVVTRARARRTTHAEHTRRRAGISRTRARTHGRTHGVMATDTASRGVGVGAVRGYWDASEERALRRAVQKHGIGAWEKMRNDPEFVALRCVWRIARIAHCGARAMRAVARRAAAAFPNATFDDDDSSSSSRVTLAWCAVLGGGRACACFCARDSVCARGEFGVGAPRARMGAEGNAGAGVGSNSRRAPND